MIGNFRRVTELELARFKANPDGIEEFLYPEDDEPAAGVELDVDKIIGYAFGLTDGLTFDLETFGIKDPVSGSVTLGNATAGPVVDLLTEVSLETELMVSTAIPSA